MDKIDEMSPLTAKQRWNKAVRARHKVNRTTKTVEAKKKLKKVKMKRLIKIRKPTKMYSAFKLVREAESASQEHQMLLEKVASSWIDRFGDRTEIVIENVNTVLGAVQAQMNAGKDPLQIAKGKEQDLINVLAGAKALEIAGPQQASMALKSYMQKVGAEQKGLQPDQAEIEAIKTAGSRAQNANQQVQQQLQAFSQAVQSGNQQQAEQIKREFAKTYGFYQQLLNTIRGAQQQNQQKPQGQMAPGMGNHPAVKNTNPANGSTGPANSTMQGPPQTATQGTPGGARGIMPQNR